MDNSQEIGNRIKLTAKKQDKSVSDVVNSCNLGKNTINDISNGKNISYLNFAKIADYLDCSVDYLLGRTDETSGHYNQSFHAGDINLNDVNSSHVNVGNTIGEKTDMALDSEFLIEVKKIYDGLTLQEKARFISYMYDFKCNNESKNL